MAKDEAAVLRRELGRVGTRRGRCFPPELKQRAVGWVVKRRNEGAAVSEIAAELGVAQGTIMRWCPDAPRSARLLPVEVVPTGSISIIGFRIEGLSPDQAAELLGKLR